MCISYGRGHNLKHKTRPKCHWVTNTDTTRNQFSHLFLVHPLVILTEPINGQKVKSEIDTSHWLTNETHTNITSILMTMDNFAVQ